MQPMPFSGPLNPESGPALQEFYRRSRQYQVNIPATRVEGCGRCVENQILTGYASF
jgi:hypothetical protein